MVSVFPLQSLQLLISKLVNRLDRWIWPQNKAIDSTSVSFYQFQPFPHGLKKHQVSGWVKLQKKRLTPFTTSDSYEFVSTSGLHLWICTSPFTGIPETAAQQALPDGQYIVQGKNHAYRQTWSKFQLINCEVMASVSEISQGNNDITKLLQQNEHGWAIPRKLDSKLRQASVWLGIVAFCAICVVVWMSTAYLSGTIQRSAAEQQVTALQETLGDKLSMQADLNQALDVVNGLSNWHQEYAFLPETLASVASVINRQNNWQLNTLTWQNRVISMEVYSSDLDITQMVVDLEQLPNLTQINIRPHISDNTWILEATVK